MSGDGRPAAIRLQSQLSRAGATTRDTATITAVPGSAPPASAHSTAAMTSIVPTWRSRRPGCPAPAPR